MDMLSTGPRLMAALTGRLAPLFVREHESALDGDEGGKMRRVMSGIRKQLRSTLDAPDLISVDPLGLAADEQADLTVHGGLDKAVYVYPSQHYGFWREMLEMHRPDSPLLANGDGLPWGTMGENLVISELNETTVWIGDRLLIGDCEFLVTAPRRPCYKFNAVMGWNGAAKAMMQSGLTGWYMRVLRPGSLCASDHISLIPGPREMQVAERHRQTVRQADMF